MTGTARLMVPGTAAGPVLALDEGLSFWGGVDPATGRIIDAHHPQHGADLSGRIVLMPTSRGSCTGSGVLLELALNGHAPAALVFCEDEEVLTLGALVAGLMFDLSLPVLRLDRESYAALARCPEAKVGERLEPLGLPLSAPGPEPELTAADRALLQGSAAEAVAMEIVVAMARVQGAARLTDVTRAHIDGCIYASPANLTFAERMRDLGARVRVPTTMNAISVEHGTWAAAGVPALFGTPAQALADAYVAMGARPSFTCAPYLLDAPPGPGEIIAWSESNAVIYANSVLGARSPKHPDFLDLCMAVTGRAPLSGVYLDAARRPGVIVEAVRPEGADDAFWPLLGHALGRVAPDRIPLLRGLEGTAPTEADLKALCAAFGTTSGAPMLHVAGITPEAELPPLPDAPVARLDRAALARSWEQFNAGPEEIDLVALGSPHFSAPECAALADLLTAPVTVPTIVTLGPGERDRAGETIDRLREKGVTVITEICWCSISEPVFPPAARTLMTNSGKYAHYAPGLHGRAVRFGSLADCARAAMTGRAAPRPGWL